MKVKQKSNIFKRRYDFENIQYETFNMRQKYTIIKVFMTTLLTHNAVVSMLMENFQKKLNNKANLSHYLKN